MFKYKKISPWLYCTALLTTLGFYDVNLVSAKASKIINTGDENIAVAISAKSTRAKVNLNLISGDKSMTKDAFLGNYSAPIPSKWRSPKSQSGFSTSGDRDLQLLASRDPNQEAIFNSDFARSQEFNNDGSDSKSGIKIIQIVSLSLFLLLFVPFGIFYPFFLFYKKLLNVDIDNSEADNLIQPSDGYKSQYSASLDPTSYDFGDRDSDRATVSKLQMAFSPQSNQLRQKLAQISSDVDFKTDTGTIELMRKTISILINQDRWTHVSQSSISLPLELVKSQFDVIYITEESKLMSEELSLVNGSEQPLQPNNSSVQNDARYIVVTLVMCTSHTSPLFDEILTQSKLSKILTQLGKMRKDDLIKFELLWNPRQRDELLSNNELLINYSDLMRLL